MDTEATSHSKQVSAKILESQDKPDTATTAPSSAAKKSAKKEKSNERQLQPQSSNDLEYVDSNVVECIKIPESVVDQVKQVEMTSKSERALLDSYPFSFENGYKVSSDVNNPEKVQLAPTEMIRAELRMRDQRGELNHDSCPLLIKLASLYKVPVFEVKPQMFPSSVHSSKNNTLAEPASMLKSTTESGLVAQKNIDR